MNELIAFFIVLIYAIRGAIAFIQDFNKLYKKYKNKNAS